MKCPKCHLDNPDDARFCSNCATPITPADEPQPSFTKTIETPETKPTHATSGSSWAVDHGRFLPGTILAGRYRIVGLLGKGGMGEVYRADDLKLGQAVALKFLPPRFSADPKRLEYFHNEVRLARQVSHPNVCRVYDIGEVDGQHFLSMEYVDGEDLATLIRRIGRLPQEKGLYIAKQLCAGLSAAHSRGVIHRDLKPSNVMIDGRGRVRITDFGLALLSAEQESAETQVGTPAYMAPEQLGGAQASEQSDIFSLGLILFEVFTGKPAHEPSGEADPRQLRDRPSSPAPSSIIPDLDPAIEQVIQKSLEENPNNRPQSALAVASLLPGGDPLAAALAAGETPSPEMVAAAGKSGRLRPPIAFAWLAVLLLGLIASAFLADKSTVLGNAGLTEKPDALDKVARDIIEEFGYDTHPKDRAYGFAYESDYLWSLRTDGSESISGGGTAPEKRPGMYFWFRQSPHYLLPIARYEWMVSAEDPPPTLPGMVGIRLKGNGDLIEFIVVPHKDERRPDEPENAAWEKLFELAGLDIGGFSERTDNDPIGLAPASADRRFAWLGTSREAARDIRVEAASYHGRPVYFRVFEDPPAPKDMRLGIPPTDRQPMRVEKMRSIEWTSVLLVLIAAALLARRSLRLGRSDRKGAFKLGLFIFSFNLIAWLMAASHVPHFPGELALVWTVLREAIFYGVYFGLMYLAFEPYMRRFWPKLLISWNRLLSGRFRDPSVGRDLLIGAAVGVWFWPVMEFLTVLAPDWLRPVQPFWRTIPSTLLGGRYLLAVSIFCLSAVGVSLVYLLSLLLLRLLLRKWWLWAPAFVIQGTFFFLLSDVASPARWIMAIAMMTGMLFLYLRLGLMAVIACLFVGYILVDFPLTAKLDAWYSGSSLFALAVVAALGLYGFLTSSSSRALARN